MTNVIEDDAAWKAAVRRVAPNADDAFFDGAIRDAARRAA